jgi:hypothetical protein
MLTDTLAKTSTNNFFLSSIWMSGYGIAADPNNGSLYFAPETPDQALTVASAIFKRA